MPRNDPVSRSIAVLDLALRQAFPDDFDRRCMYAAFGLKLLLAEAGFATKIMGGDFLCLVLGSHSRESMLQGFGSSTSPESSHYWIETGAELVDLGPSYLPKGSSFRALPMPVIRWRLTAALPTFLQYRARVQWDTHVELDSSNEIRQRMADFLDTCQRLNQIEAVALKPTAWQLRDFETLRFAAQKGERWAAGALEYSEYPPREGPLF